MYEKRKRRKKKRITKLRKDGQKGWFEATVVLEIFGKRRWMVDQKVN